MSLKDARISTRFGNLHLEHTGWRLAGQPQGSTGLPGLPSARPQWSVINEGLLKLHGWNPGTDTAWQGVFVPGSRPFSPEWQDTIKGVGDCKLVSVEGSIVGHPEQNLPARIEFAMAKDRCMMLWRAEVSNTGPRDVELETITMLNGRAGVGGTLAKKADSLKHDVRKAVEVGIWAWTSLILVLPFAFRIMSLVLRVAVLATSFVGASFLCKSLQSALSLEHDPVWDSVLINGWQSFSYAGYLPLDSCYGVSGAIRRALAMTGLWTMQPSPQTGAAFSGAFHEGGKMPPRSWLGREGTFPSWLNPLSWRQSALVKSDMFTSLSAGFSTASPIDHVQLVAGFLGQREQFGVVALDPWTQKLALHASCKFSMGVRARTLAGLLACLHACLLTRILPRTRTRTHARTHTRTHAHAHASTCTHTHAHARTCTHTHAHTHTRTHMRTHARTRTSIHASTQTHRHMGNIRVYIHTYTFIRTCTYTYIHVYTHIYM